MYKKDPVIYIGYDEREHDAFEVLVHSIKKHASKPITIIPLKQDKLRAAGLYSRLHHTDNDGQFWDSVDGRPFSTQFSFTRFLVPALNQYEGLALFMDCDMLVRSDIWEVFDYCTDPKRAVYTVFHKYNPDKGLKLDNKIQQSYSKKNWSSFVVYNCDHPIHLDLTSFDVSRKSGRYLHTFGWLNQPIYFGEIPEKWNWLDHHSSENIEAKNVHFTTGGPWYTHWKASRDADEKYASEWLSEYNNLQED